MPSKSDIEKINKITEAKLAGMIDSHQEKILSAIVKLEDRITNDLTKLSIAKDGRFEGLKVNLKQAQNVHKKIIADFAEEYNFPASDLIGDFSEITKLVESSYKYLDNAAKFSEVSEKTIEVLKNQHLEQYERYGKDAQEKISKAMYDSVIAREPFSTLLKTVEGVLTGHKNVKGRPMEVYAKQHAFDSVMNFNNQVNTLKSEELGIKHFMYVGNIMDSSRDFCIERVGKIYSKKEIDSWQFDWKGKAGSAMTHRGGYNCRHHWRGVRPEWFDLEDEDGEKTPIDLKAAMLPEKEKKTLYNAKASSGLKPTGRVPSVNHVKLKSKDKIKFGLGKDATQEEWLKHRQTWDPIETVDDGLLQLKNKYKILNPQLKFSPNKSEDYMIKALNESGETIANMYRKAPGINKHVFESSPLENFVLYSNDEAVTYDFYLLKLEDYNQKARAGALTSRDVIPTLENTQEVAGISWTDREYKRHLFSSVNPESSYFPLFKNTPGTSTACADAYSTLRHEYGHYIHQSMNFSLPRASYDWMKEFQKMEKLVDRFSSPVSSYSTTNGEELWAELFSVYTHPFTDVAEYKKLLLEKTKYLQKKPSLLKKHLDWMDEQVQIVEKPISGVGKFIVPEVSKPVSEKIAVSSIKKESAVIAKKSETIAKKSETIAKRIDDPPISVPLTDKPPFKYSINQKYLNEDLGTKLQIENDIKDLELRFPNIGHLANHKYQNVKITLRDKSPFNDGILSSETNIKDSFGPNIDLKFDPKKMKPKRYDLTGKSSVVDDSFSGLLRHNIGQAIHQNMDSNISKRWIDLREEFKIPLSKTAKAGGASSSKNFSEVFSAYASPYYKRGDLPLRVEAFFDDITGARLTGPKLKLSTKAKTLSKCLL